MEPLLAPDLEHFWCMLCSCAAPLCTCGLVSGPVFVSGTIKLCLTLCLTVCLVVGLQLRVAQCGLPQFRWSNSLPHMPQPRHLHCVLICVSVSVS